MKKYILMSIIALAIGVINIFAQDIPQSQVPSLVLNSFQQKYPKAYDVEWELKGDLYKVEFEKSLLGDDVEVWFDKSGKVVRSKEEISKSELPKAVLDKIDAEFKASIIKDVEKFNENGTISYKVEIKTIREEWDVLFDEKGNILSKKLD